VSQTMFESSQEQGVLVFEFFEISKFGRMEMGKEVQSELQNPAHADARDVLIDCQHLKYANSLFLEVLLQMASETEKRGGRFVLCALDDFLLQVFEVTRLQDRWKLYPDRQQAIADLVASR